MQLNFCQERDGVKEANLPGVHQRHQAHINFPHQRSVAFRCLVKLLDILDVAISSIDILWRIGAKSNLLVVHLEGSRDEPVSALIVSF